MAQPPIRRKINTEDYEAQYSSLVTRLAYALNPFIDEVVDNLENGIDFNNLARNLITINIQIDGSGNITSGNRVNVGVTNPPGLNVVKVINLTNSRIYPTSAPFISFTPIENGIINIDNITGLTGGNNYQITIEVLL